MYKKKGFFKNRNKKFTFNYFANFKVNVCGIIFNQKYNFLQKNKKNFTLTFFKEQKFSFTLISEFQISILI